MKCSGYALSDGRGSPYEANLLGNWLGADPDIRRAMAPRLFMEGVNVLWRPAPGPGRPQPPRPVLSGYVRWPHRKTFI